MRMRSAGIDVQVFSLWCDGLQKNPFAFANREIDSLYAWAARNPAEMMLVKTPQDLQTAIHQHKLGAMLGVEGGHMIENNLSNLDSLYARGARYMTLTWNNSTAWATSAKDETQDSALKQPKGLNDFGKQIVRHMNELGMMIDLSHVGEQTFWDAIHTSTKPVIVSHSCAYALCPVFRNLKDEQIKAVAKNGGVIDINFFSGFIDSNFEKRSKAFIQKHKAEKDSLMQSGKPEALAEDYLFEKYTAETNALRPPLSMLLDHIDYIVKLAGIEHVGMGSDFDGISSAPQELNSVTDFPLITKGLLERGYTKKDIKKFWEKIL